MKSSFFVTTEFRELAERPLPVPPPAAPAAVGQVEAAGQPAPVSDTGGGPAVPAAGHREPAAQLVPGHGPGGHPGGTG